MSTESNGGKRPVVRLWWATLPYEGWTWYSGEVEVGAVPCPWWAHPIAWVHRIVDGWFRFRGKGDPWR